MIEQYAHEVVVLFLFSLACLLFYLGRATGKNTYNKSNNHYNDEDCT